MGKIREKDFLVGRSLCDQVFFVNPEPSVSVSLPFFRGVS